MTQQAHHIGMVGIGLMGLGIAQNLLRHGHALTVLEHPGNQPLESLLAAGARSTGDLRALAGGCEVLLLCVTGSPQVEAVLFGEGGAEGAEGAGALAALPPGAVVIDCSTALPASTARVAAAVQAGGCGFLDAAMTRTPKEAAEGRLNLLVGGDAALFARWRPLLACFAEHITHCGDAGAGHRMKLLHNYVSLGTVALIAEAAACAARGGVAPDVLVDVLAKGGGGGAALERLRPFLLAHDASGLRFFMANAQKDLGYYTRMAAGTGAARAIAEGVQATYDAAVAGLGAQALVPELVDFLTAAGGGESAG